LHPSGFFFESISEWNSKKRGIPAPKATRWSIDKEGQKSYLTFVVEEKQSCLPLGRGFHVAMTTDGNV
jgi:hypothetical protein